MKVKHIIISCAIVASLVAIAAVCWQLKLIDFLAPIWLAALLLLPLLAYIAVKGISGLPSHTNAVSMTMRCLLFVMLVLCLAEIQFVLKNDGLSVLYLMDNSASIPDDIAARQLGYINATAEKQGKKDSAGIVVFGESASVEVMPVKGLKVDRIYSAINRSYTDLQGAIELATTAFPANTRKKIVLITDGNENKGNILEGLKFAAGNQVEVAILPVTYDYEKEVLVEKVFLPDRIKENETFDLKVHVYSLQDCPADLSIYRNGVCVVREKMNLEKGRNTYAAAMKIDEPGFYSFAAQINAEADTVPDNNKSTGYVYIQGQSRTLMVAPTQREVSHLASACRENNIETDIIAPEEMPESLGMLQNHDCVILANVPADALSESQMSMLQANVRDLGVGLIMLGGKDSFGAGGYEETPIEEALPVSMDIRQKKINPKGALVLVLHTCEFADGNYWAKQISKKAIETISSKDDVGVLLYRGGEKWLFELQPATDKKALYAKIDSAVPGDMPSFAPTINMAHAALSKSDAMVKHVIIISDGDPARPQPNVVKSMADMGITISTVAINPHSPRDVDVMKYLAYETGGRYYFADDPSVLPKIFSKEAKVVKRSIIFNKEFRPNLVLSTELTKGIRQEDIPTLMAYVATTAKPRALVPLVSDNENKDPIFAYWRYGLGKAVAFTSDASSNWGKDWIQWNKYEKFWTQIIRWASRKREKSCLRIHAQMEGGAGKLVIDAVDAKGKFINFLKLNGRIVDPHNKGSVMEIRQTAPGQYAADFKAEEVGVNIVNVGYQNPQTGEQGFDTLGISIPYSPEYRHLESNISLLRRAVKNSGGKFLTGDPEKDEVFVSNLAAMSSFKPIWEYLLIAALFVFFFDVVIRRVIITREDFANAFSAMKNRLRIKKKAGVQDATMAALLKRKEKTFEKVTRKTESKSQDFKKKLDQAAENDLKAGEKINVLDEMSASEPKGSKPAKGEIDKPSEKAGIKPPVTGEDSYTGRLLAAKKRAKGQKKKDDEFENK